MMSKQNVPELRFPEFSGEWREHTWKDIGEYKKSYSFSRAHEGEGLYRHIHYGDIHSKLPSIIKSSEILPRISTSDDLETVLQGDILIADASEDYKDLGKTVLVKTQESEIVSGLHTIRFRPINNIDSTFLLYFTKSISYRKFITKMGTGVSVLGLSKTNLAKLKINLPEIEEQKKIGKFFRKIDRLIELEEKKLELLEEQKKGYMQKIFSQELRFKDEDGNDYPEWEEKKLVNISKIQNGYAFKSSKFKEKGNRIIRISDIQNNMITNGTAFYPLEINISSLFK